MRPLHIFSHYCIWIYNYLKRKIKFKNSECIERNGWIYLHSGGDVLYVSDCIIAECIFPLGFKQLLNLSNINCIIYCINLGYSCRCVRIIKVVLLPPSSSRPSHKTPRLFNQPPTRLLHLPHHILVSAFRFCNYVIQSFLHLAGIKALP